MAYLSVITSLETIAHIIAWSLDTDHLFDDYIITDYKYNSLLSHCYYYFNLGSKISFKKSKTLWSTFEVQKICTVY